MPPPIPLGFSIPDGEPVWIPLRHLAITGQTQESGKTTTLEALVDRTGVPAIAFVTKRGEGSFAAGRRLQPYFRERADWQFVDQLLEAQLREKNKFLRPWLIRICRNTRTLAEVHAAIKSQLKKAKGISEGVYTQLDAYLDLIVPEIARARLATSIDLQPGLNVMDVSGFPTPMQMLFVQSAIDWVNEKEKGVVVIVPEAWEFIPEGRGSPVKASAVNLVRKGAGLGNFIWVDSQDMAGVAKEILRGCTVWLIGVQREANEIKRNLANIPAGIARPKPADIARLEKGQFFACWKDQTIKTYVQPAWCLPTIARLIARGDASIDDLMPRYPSPVSHSSEDPMPSSTDEKLDTLIELLSRNPAFAGGQAASQYANAATDSLPPVFVRPASSTTPQQFDDAQEALYQSFKARLAGEAPHLIQILAIKPEITVEVETHTITYDGATMQGRVAKLMHDGFFDAGKAPGEVRSELCRTGSDPGPSAAKFLPELVSKGFLVRTPGGRYQAVEGMKVNIRQK